MSRRRRSAAGQAPHLLLVVVGLCFALGAVWGNGRHQRPNYPDALAALSTLALGMTTVRRGTPSPAEPPDDPDAERTSPTEPGFAEMRACLDLAARTANLGYWDLDPASGRLRVSKEWTRQLGYPNDEIPSRLADWESLVHPDDLAEARAHHRALASSAPPKETTWECRLRHRNGTYRWMRIRARVIEGSDRARPQVLGCTIDVTERREIEEHCRRLRQQLRQVEQMSEMGTLVAGVAHEVRNPLFGITATLDAMEARGLDPVQLRQQIVRLRGEVDRVSRLMSDLLDYGRPQKVTLRYQPPHLLVAAAVEACRLLAEESQVEIEVLSAADLPAIRIDRERMATALQNVIRNAIEHSARGSRVTVSFASLELAGVRWLGLAVRDRGPGFEPEELDRVFEPFHSRRPGGIGLGLAIARRIVRAHGGEIAAANGAEGGGVVAIRLPAAAAADGIPPLPGDWVSS